MKIHNIRLGLATNSSSSHSIIILEKGRKLSDRDLDGGAFGWQYFTAASREAKSQYVALQLWSAIVDAVGGELAPAVMRELELPMPSEDGYVDHQSCYRFPVSWDGKAIDMAFARAFRDLVLRDDVAILGGNDNDGTEHPAGPGFTLALEQDGWSPLMSNTVARNDKSHWVLFNRKTGAKIRMSFGPDDPTPKRSLTPELVDVKITDFCTRGCAYCYQGSTPEGKHADISALHRIINALAALRVFEVAIGGGEPTDHPHFREVVRSFREANIVPNFTTRSLEWLLDDGMRELVLRDAGQIAFSVDTAAQVTMLAGVLRRYPEAEGRITVQYVLGAHPVWDLPLVLNAAMKAELPVTLLGYKTTGRGGAFRSKTPSLSGIGFHPYLGFIAPFLSGGIIAPFLSGGKDRKSWLDMVEYAKAGDGGLRLSIDTTLAAESAELLSARADRYPRVLYGTDEGRFSMYIDAVRMVTAPSSFAPDQEVALEKEDRDLGGIQRFFDSWNCNQDRG